MGLKNVVVNCSVDICELADICNCVPCSNLGQ